MEAMQALLRQESIWGEKPFGKLKTFSHLGLPRWCSGKESACQAGDAGSIPGEGNDNPLSILAWEIPWTEEPGGLQSVGLQRVRYNLATKLYQQWVLVI